MISALATIFGGPLVGILGSVISGITGYFEKKQQIEADKVRFAHEASLLAMQIQARGEEMENERAIATMNTDSANLVASYQHDMSAGPTSQWVANTLRLVRPVLTVGLMSIVAYLVVAQLAEPQTVAMKVLFLTEVALSWWFADRRRAAAK